MLFQIKVITNAKKNEVIKLDEKNYKVKVTVPPAEGRANLKVIEVIADYFKSKKSDVKIIKGDKSHNKIVEIKIK